MKQIQNIMTFCGIAILALASHAPAHAQDTTKPLSKHIKIGESRPNSASINIINSNFYDEKRKIAREYNKLVPKADENTPKLFKHINIDTKVDISVCPFNIGNNTLSAKHLAGALRYYLQAQDQNYKSIDAIYNASIKMNVDFGVMALSAMLESDFGHNTVSPTSSARGMYQFIDSTWLILIKKYGSRIGYNDESKAIQIDVKTGKISVNESSRITRESILAIRNNNKTSSLVKAIQIKEEEIALKEFGLTNPHATDFYIAHMLGLGMAKKIYSLLDNESTISLADSGSSGLRSAADLNPYFFYASAKTQPLNAMESYARFHTHVTQAIKRLRKIEDDFGIGEDLDLFRPPCTIDKKA